MEDKIIYSTSLKHEYESKYVDKKQSAVRRTGGYIKTKKILGREPRENKYGKYRRADGKPYASESYDPEARHERYLQERDSLGVGSSGKSGGSGGSSGRSSAKKGGSGRSKGSANNEKLAAAIEQLRQDSMSATEEKRQEAAKKIQDIQKRIEARIKELQSGTVNSMSDSNSSAENRGLAQSLTRKIEKVKLQGSKEASGVSKELSKWMSAEQKSLEKRIQELTASGGK